MKRTIGTAASAMLVASSLIALEPNTVPNQEPVPVVVQEEVGILGGIKLFFVNAFTDMKESAIEQHQVDKANFLATKLEAKAQWEEAKSGTLSSRETGHRKHATVELHEKRSQQLDDANQRILAAQSRIDAAQK
ncbi:MAG: hypothetical protein IKW26_05080 [Treponema sp.]|nr:hypothetical protein [Treponema sp.]